MNLRLPLPGLPAGDRSLAWALFAALALHAAALAWLRPQLWQPLPASRPGGTLHVVLQAASVRPADHLPGQVAIATHEGDDGAGIEQALPRHAAGTTAASAQVPPGTGDGTGPPRPVEYLPRDRLTRPPRPQSEVPLAFPAVDGLVDLKVRLSLYIDESGAVRDLRVDTPDVPPVFVQAIHAAFGSTRFSPGEVDSVPVPSMVRLEVEFSTRPPE